MFIQGSTGYIGIGTTSPTCPLHVVGSANISPGSSGNGYYYGVSSSGTYALSASGNFSASFSTSIIASAYVSNSDKRLKSNIIMLDREYCKQFIQKTNPVSYTLISDGHIHYGYIAQDIIKAGYEKLVSAAPEDNIKETIDDDGFLSPKDIKLVKL